ncbi:Uncharacterised protein [[Ruminococcus] torques]|nr:Uncharacterised protein [[Ruminococcus] torques]
MEIRSRPKGLIFILKTIMKQKGEYHDRTDSKRNH